MEYASDLQSKETGFVIYNFLVHKVTVSSIKDISYHGSPCYVFHTKEIENEHFFELYTEKEAYEKLYNILLKSKETIKNRIINENKKKKYIKTQLQIVLNKIQDLT